jgi:hypothetical protein
MPIVPDVFPYPSRIRLDIILALVCAYYCFSKFIVAK